MSQFDPNNAPGLGSLRAKRILTVYRTIQETEQCAATLSHCFNGISLHSHHGKLKRLRFYSRIRIHDGPGRSIGDARLVSFPDAESIRNVATLLPAMFAQMSVVPSDVMARF